MSRSECFSNWFGGPTGWSCTGCQDINAATKNLIGIDCMGFVNQLKIHDGIETLSDLADQFVSRLEHECQWFDIVVLAFDLYNTLKPSLKQQTWDDR